MFMLLMYLIFGPIIVPALIAERYFTRRRNATQPPGSDEKA